MKNLSILLITLIVFLAGLVTVCSAQRRTRTIQLPVAKSTGSMSLEEILTKQQIVHQFTGEAIKTEQIGQLVWAGLATTEKISQPTNQPQNTVPESPLIQLYIATQDGVYLYNSENHSLQQTLGRDIRDGLATATSNTASASAGCHIIITSTVRNLRAQSTNKTRQHILIQVGHIAQNIQLQAISLGLGTIAIEDFDIRNVRKVCSLPRSLEPCYIVTVGYPMAKIPAQMGQNRTTLASPEPLSSSSKQVVLIIPPQQFNYQEFFYIKSALDTANIKTAVASTRVGTISGTLRGTARATILVKSVRVDDYDAIIFIGGIGTKQYFYDPIILNIARQTVEKKKVLGAIYNAPSILANAGVLKGVRATSIFTQQTILQRAGAKYTRNQVVQDGLIITATETKMASDFGRVIANALADR